MKINRYILSISAALGATLLTISALSIIVVLNSLSERPIAKAWDFYMENFYYYLQFAPYFFMGVFSLFLLFYALEIQKKFSN